MGRAYMHGWVSLPSQGELYLEHGVPRQVRVEDVEWVVVERVADEIADVTGLRVTLEPWRQDEDSGEMEAAVRVDARDIAVVLSRLAHESAETFYDRYRKSIDESDTDFDEEAYAQDFSLALGACGLHWGEIDHYALRDGYRHALHRASESIARHPE